MVGRFILFIFLFALFLAALTALFVYWILPWIRSKQIDHEKDRSLSDVRLDKKELDAEFDVIDEEHKLYANDPRYNKKKKK